MVSQGQGREPPPPPPGGGGGVSRAKQEIGVSPTWWAHNFRLEIFFKLQLALVQATELVDLVLVLAAHLDLVACRGLIVLGELGTRG